MSLPLSRLAEIVQFLRGRYASFDRFLPRDLTAYQGLRKALVSLLSFYEGEGLPKAIERDIDALLSEEAEERGIFNPLSLPLSSLPKTAYWKGDIRRIATDGVVFSINPNLDGSLVPGDTSLEAQIQAAVGPSFKENLRALRTTLKSQERRLGAAFVLPSRNLPSKKLIAVTVPQIEVRVTEHDEKALRQAYWSALSAAEKNHLKTLAFASLATGGNRYPYREAARAAVDAVEVYHSRHDESPIVVFVLPDDKQYDYYEELLG